ncbi:MAG: ABC transporter ATP-binding protein [Candidatus Bathyarchaeota archaeon]|nr:ABC transporter ATP-binding protein [Candidatus Bathyarchaeota archaeon]
MSGIAFEIQNLKKYFGPVKAVDDVSLTIRKKETHGLVGESGCGKTTLGRTILRLLEPTAGNLFITTSLSEKDPIKRFKLSTTDELRSLRRRMQIVYQDPASSLNPRMIIRDIVGEPIAFHQGLKGDELQNRIVELLKFVGLQEEHLWRYSYEMSGGQRQRVAIARAIALNPDFIVLDEPTSALDVSVQAKVLKLLKELQRDMDLSYLFITHDMSVIDYMCDRVSVMYVGKIVETSDKNKLFEDPLHPYTQALVSAVPSIDPTNRKLATAEALIGEVPSPANPPTGCKFHPRCKQAFKECGWGAKDLKAWLKENCDEIFSIMVVRNGFHLELESVNKDEGDSLTELTDIIEKGQKRRDPLFESIETVEKINNRINVHFVEKTEPELIERVEPDRYVACLLYPALDRKE